MALRNINVVCFVVAISQCTEIALDNKRDGAINHVCKITKKMAALAVFNGYALGAKEGLRRMLLGCLNK